ncbi:MAG: class I tRNA ligase family protein [Spirochaetales bacterium]|nr:class I tRNA ligase family protein [Spirochaetales bacterium]
MTKEKGPFTPLEAKKVKIFTCGPSIYQRPHIGNYRTFLYEDLLIRFLEFQGNQVDRIINLTDIEDKSIEEAHSKGEKMADMTSNAADYFRKETKELHIKLPKILPSSSSTINEAAEITKTLIEKGFAYKHTDGVFFDPLKSKNFGKLFGLDMTRWPEKRLRFKKDTYNGNRWNRGDFILWHADKGEHIHFWDSVVGRGRPSWNIQDPAIIHSHLGEQIDINCGGIDNIYRHHDYNIAIMEALTGKEYAQIYLHGEHLVVDGSSMSKSRGNILYPEHIYDKGFSPEELRFFLTSQVHYRKKLNFTWTHIEKSSQRLKVIRKMIEQLTILKNGSPDKSDEQEVLISTLENDFIMAMEDDLHLAEGINSVEKNLKLMIKIYPDGLDAKNKYKLKTAVEKIDTILCCLI